MSRPANPHPDAFGVSTGHPMVPGPDCTEVLRSVWSCQNPSHHRGWHPAAGNESGPVNRHPGPDFAPPEPEAGS